MNDILISGNNLYSSIRCYERNNDLLLLTDLPKTISFSNQVFEIQYGESLTASLFMTPNGGPYMTLENAITVIFSNSQPNFYSCLLTIGINTVAVFKICDEKFKVFYSHSRDLKARLLRSKCFGDC